MTRMAKAIQQERKGVQSGTWDHFLWKFLKPRQRSQVIPTVLTAKLTLSFMLFVCLLFSCQVISDSLRLHGLQHTRLLYSTLYPGVCSNSSPMSW